MSTFKFLSTTAADAFGDHWASGYDPLNPFASSATDEIDVAGLAAASSNALDVVAHPFGCGCFGCGLLDDTGTNGPAPNAPAEVTLNNLPVATLQQMADYLRVGFWNDTFFYPHNFNLESTGILPNSGVLLYNVTGYDFTSDPNIARADTNGITAARAELVRDAFDLFEEVLGIDFVETTSTNINTVDFFFSDNDSGAYASTYIDGGTLTTAAFSFINVDINWSGGTSTYNDYTLQTIIHEIGHGLGLGHQGNYNVIGGYPGDAEFANDSWQATIMSYFDQLDNTTINADYALLQTPMAVDWLALDDIYSGQSHNGVNYGIGNAFNGNTIYGFNTNISAATNPIWAAFATYANVTASTIVDADGIDTLDFSGYSQASRIDLTPSSASGTAPTISDIGGLVGNLTLAVGTIIENAIGGSGDDTLIGNSVGNQLIGNNGNDTISGDLGWDLLVGGIGNDNLDGGAGNDTLDGGDGNDTMDGGEGDDRLWTGNGDNVVMAGGGADIVGGGNGRDSVEGGAGNDVIRGWAGFDTLIGGDNDDEIYGGDGLDRLFGDNGNDMLFGEGGSDTIYGGEGADTMVGGDGDDILWAGHGNNSIDGGTGNEIIAGGRDRDFVTMGIGDDSVKGWAGFDTIYGGEGNDTIDAGDGMDRVWGDEGNDLIFAGNGNDTIEGGIGNDTIDGGGNDDVIYTGSGMNLVYGGFGNDFVAGGDDADLIFAGRGDDTIKGWGGDDRLYSGAETSDLTGGTGNDTFYVEAAATLVVIQDFSLTDDTLDVKLLGLSSIDDVYNVASDQAGYLLLDFAGGQDVHLVGILETDLASANIVWA